LWVGDGGIQRKLIKHEAASKTEVQKKKKQ